jgi:hypothetical protein
MLPRHESTLVREIKQLPVLPLNDWSRLGPSSSPKQIDVALVRVIGDPGEPAAGPAVSACPGSCSRAFSGKVDTGFPLENATNKEQLERFPIQPDREAL